MRFLIYGVFLTLWVMMWVWTYTCHIKAACCPEGVDRTESEIITAPEEIPEADAFLSHLMENQPRQVQTALLVSDKNVHGLWNSDCDFSIRNSSAQCVFTPNKHICVDTKTKCKAGSIDFRQNLPESTRSLTRDLQFIKAQ